MIRRLPLFAALFAATLAGPLVAPSPARAAVTPQIAAQATQLMDAGRPAEAYALLRRHHAPASAGPQQWFLVGLAAYRARDLDAAEHAFRQTLARDAGSARAKLELARVLQEKGRRDEAERLFLEVRSLNPPAQVTANIDRFLAMLQNRDEKGSAWRARATIGAGYDSNVNQATTARQVNLFGLPFLLNSDARRRADGFGFFRGEFDHIHRFDRNFAWTSTLSFTARRHFRENDVDSFLVSAATGPVFQPGDRTTILIPAFVNIARYENTLQPASRRFYSNEFGIAPQVRYALTDTVSANLTTVLGRRHVFEQQQRDAQLYKSAAGLDWRVGSASILSAGLTAGREIARTSAFSNRSRGATFGWQYAFARNFVTSLHASHERVDYDSREAMNDRVRRDNRTNVGVDAVWAADFLYGDVLFSWAHTWNDSNIPLYAFERDVFSVAYRKSF